MGDVKWIKIAIDVFDNRKIKQIEAMPEGDAIVVIWFKILCLAGKINDMGMVRFSEEIPYTEQLLATEFNKPLQIVQLALSVFQKFEMIEVIDDVIQVSNWEKYQNTDEMEKLKEQNRERQRKFKAKKKQKLLESNVTVTLPVTEDNVTVTEQNESKSKDIDNSSLDNSIKVIDKNIDSEELSKELSHKDVGRGKFQWLVDEWNTLKQYGIAELRGIGETGNRPSLVKARLREYGDAGFRTAIENIRHSKFLQGNNNRGWQITFDWLIKPSNFPKVLEGNYNDKDHGGISDIEREVKSWV